MFSSPPPLPPPPTYTGSFLEVFLFGGGVGGHVGNVKMWASVGLLQHGDSENTFNACLKKF